jgi:hypothetical protein
MRDARLPWLPEQPTRDTPPAKILWRATIDDHLVVLRQVQANQGRLTLFDDFGGTVVRAGWDVLLHWNGPTLADDLLAELRSKCQETIAYHAGLGAQRAPRSEWS